MGDFLGSVRKSLVFRPNPEDNNASSSTSSTSIGFGGAITEKIGSCLRKSRVGLGLRSGLGFTPPKLPSPIMEDQSPRIRWRKGELIGRGAFGHVYMGMNLDSGELLAVKQVLIGASSALKEKAIDHIRELEEEVKLLKKLSHPNIVRYLGTAREEDTLNILLEFVPGGSISSLLGKFGSFPEAVIRMYTKQLLQGLDYLHLNKIIHRDIKGANILVDNKGCIKLADFGASKQVAKLATMNAAKSLKGTPYWMAPEVIVQSGHSFSADIWSVGCTVIEMATGKAPWSQQYQEVAALFHVGTTKSHPPIPEHLSSEAKDFLLKCLQEEPNSRATTSELLKHPFVAGGYQNSHTINSSSDTLSPSTIQTSKAQLRSNPLNRASTTKEGPGNANYHSEALSTMFPEKLVRSRSMWGTMCRFDDDRDDFPVVGSSFNPMSEPFDDWPSKFDMSPEHQINLDNLGDSISIYTSCAGTGGNDFTFPCDAVCEHDDEVTETKIMAFLDEKALELKKLQTPLYEEFFNASSVPATSPGPRNIHKPFPTEVSSEMSTASHAVTVSRVTSPGTCGRRLPCAEIENSEWGEILQETHKEPYNSPSANFSERQREWKEELDRELEMTRQARQAAVDGAPKSRKRDRWRLTSPGK